MFSRTVLVCVGLILSLEVATCNRDDDCVLKGNDQLRLDWIAREKETKDTP